MSLLLNNEMMDFNYNHNNILPFCRRYGIYFSQDRFLLSPLLTGLANNRRFVACAC